MIIGLGIDFIEVERIAKAIKNTAGFQNRIFTAEEINYCDQQAVPEQHYAARYAAKEALLKALGTGYRQGLSFGEIEVSLDQMGKPIIKLSGRCAEKAQEMGAGQIHLSLTHTVTYASAVVIIEKL